MTFGHRFSRDELEHASSPGRLRRPARYSSSGSVVDSARCYTAAMAEAVRTPRPLLPARAGEEASQRVALFVDTQNLFYAARDAAGRHLDYAALLDVALRGRLLQAATAYVVEREGEASVHGFVTRLSALGYRVRRRSVRVHRADAQGRVVLDGDWDMGIAVDVVRAFDHADVIALASGDGDFVPLLQLAQERGLRAEVLAFREAAAQSLIEVVDRFVHLGEIDGVYRPLPRS
jgi:uncharacterized LabA/DUF88 family protein